LVRCGMSSSFSLAPIKRRRSSSSEQSNNIDRLEEMSALLYKKAHDIPAHQRRSTLQADDRILEGRTLHAPGRFLGRSSHRLSTFQLFEKDEIPPTFLVVRFEVISNGCGLTVDILPRGPLREPKKVIKWSQKLMIHTSKRDILMQNNAQRCRSNCQIKSSSSEAGMAAVVAP
jgi:hypothetical protein